MAILKPGEKLDKGIEERLHRGRERLEQIAASRDEAWEFYRGNTNAYVDEKGKLQFTASGYSGIRFPGKPRWEARQSRNMIFDVVLRGRSTAVRRVPSYQVVPSTSEPNDISAARLSEKIAIYGHNQWRVRRAARDAVTHVLVTGEAFAWPYFDTSIGPFIPTDSGSMGLGDVRIAIYGSNECYWEPGIRFEDSPWHVVEQARPISRVEEMPGYLGGTLTPDADSRQLSHRGRKGANKRKLVLVSDYLERPCPKYPNGRWITCANGRQIVKERPYPGDDQEPILRKLSYASDPDSDRDLGLVQQIIDAQRTKDDSENKAILWKNLCLFPQFAATPGTFRKQRRTPEPGKVYEVAQPNDNLMVIPTPNVPSELFEMADRAVADIERISARHDISQEESGKAKAAQVDSDESRDADFMGDLAEFYSAVMHDSLVLVQIHYTEDRLIQIKGDFGWESIADFRGASLRGQVDVRVFPDSIEPQTKQAVEQRVMNYANLGWIGPEQAMSALESGTAEPLFRAIKQDEGRVGRIIQRIKQGLEALFAMPEVPTGRLQKVPMTGPDGQPMTDEMGQPMMMDGPPEYAPGWMPRWADNLGVWRSTFEDWIKTEEFERLAVDQQEAASLVYGKILELEAQKAAEAQQAQMAQAEQMGMDAAARPQGAKPLPTMPSLDSQTPGNGSAPR